MFCTRYMYILLHMQKVCTCAKHIVLHMQKYMFCITYEKLYIILNKKRRAFHEEAPTTKITTDTAFVFCV